MGIRLDGTIDFLEYRATVVEVIDGDTIDVNIDLGFDIQHKNRLRMYGINAPESRTRDKVEKAAGLKSKAWLKALIEGKKITVRTYKDGTVEKFGRLLARVYIDGVDVNAEMVKQDLAKEYFGGKR